MTLRSTFIFVVMSLMLTFFSVSYFSAQEPVKKVLIFNSDQPYMPSTEKVSQAFSAAIQKDSPVRVQFFYENLDTTKISNEKYESEFAKMLQAKYGGENIELAFAVSTPALRFLTKYRQSILNTAPIVYLAVDSSRLAGMDIRTNMTGVTGHADFRPTLDIAMSLLPDTKKVVVIADNSTLDQGLLNQARLQYADYENKAEFAYLTDRTLQDYQREVAQLSPGTVVIFISLLTDSAGNSYSGPDSAESVAKSSSVPVFCLSQSHLGHGMVGGSVINFGALGVGAGEMARRILSGEKAEAIPSKTFESEPMFDARELSRWNIREEALPAGSILLFDEPTIWEQYRWYVIVSIAFSVFEFALIVWLLYMRSRRRQAESERRKFAALAAEEHKRLDEVVANVPGVVWESHVEGSGNERRVDFISDYVEKMLGYTPEEFVSGPNFWLKVVHEEDRERWVAAKEIVGGERNVAQEFRFVTKDGIVIWAEATLVPKHDAEGNVVGIRGIAVDVTDRKLAEDELYQRELELREAQRLSRTGNWEWDQATNTVRWSEELYRIAGIDSSQPAVHWDQHKKIYTPESYDRLALAVATAFESGMPYDLEIEMIRADKRHVWVRARGEVVRDSNSKIIKLRGTLQDISDEKQAKLALKLALDEVNELREQLHEENIYLREVISLDHNFGEIIGDSDALKYVLFKIEQVAPTDATVLITGETGTGKELVARAIHSNSKRKSRPLVRVNCAALSASLIESELFGHERGSFTGASARKIGRFELADKGSIFLDEVGELPLDLQVKLLRVLQEGEFERLGSSETIKVDARVIAATNRNLEAEVKKGTFRQDLLFRLNVFPITVPPLRERSEDIPALIEHFTHRFSKKLGKDIRSISPAAIRRMSKYWWPGNIRELANVVERSVISTQGTTLHFSESLESRTETAESAITDKTLEMIERKHIIQVLDSTGWKIDGTNGAAMILGLHPNTLRSRMAKLSISRKSLSRNNID